MKHGTKLLVVALLSCGSLQAQNVVPAYAIQGKDSTCQIFVYSPGEREGLHLAFLLGMMKSGMKWGNFAHLIMAHGEQRSGCLIPL